LANINTKRIYRSIVSIIVDGLHTYRWSSVFYTIQGVGLQFYLGFYMTKHILLIEIYYF